MRPEHRAVELRREIALRIERPRGDEDSVHEQQPDGSPRGSAHAAHEIDQPGGRDAETDPLQNARDAVVLAVECEKSDRFRARPRATRMAARKWFAREHLREAPVARRSPKESAMDTPTRKRKKGKMVSVSSNRATRRGGAAGTRPTGVPGLFTTIMPAIVAPRIASTDSRRCIGLL